eukprot:gnl/Dysnectes_brevis/556_a614_2357.p1 GENE.gnl/Dysnectes_brevis/556_a614_2357~~gnl/Dysnectes_brevis/556_a614_2357.p1  ORF type:complete len:846 (-),score=196.92 gnl/Dysnectes_brevis/556_a614_2357:35-2572(-)
MSSPQVTEFDNLTKSVVLQECRQLGDQKTPSSVQKTIMTRLLFLINTNTEFTKAEANDIFFSLTKVLYLPSQEIQAIGLLCIQGIIHLVDSAFFLMRSLTKIIENCPPLKASAIRLLSKVAGESSQTHAERIVKLALTDSDTRIQIAAARTAESLGLSMPEQAIRALSKAEDLPAAHIRALAPARRARGVPSKGVHDQLYMTGGMSKEQLFALLPGDGGSKAPLSSSEGSFAGAMPALQALRLLCSMTLTDRAEIKRLGDGLTNYLRYRAASSPAKLVVLRLIASYMKDHDYRPFAPLVRKEVDNGSLAVSALASVISLEASGAHEGTAARLASLLPKLKGEVRLEAAQAVGGFCRRQPSAAAEVMPALGGLLASDDPTLSVCAFETLSAMLSVAGTRTLSLDILLHHFEDCREQDMSTRIAGLLADIGGMLDTQAMRRRVVAALWNRVILESVRVRSAAYHSLGALMSSFAAQQQEDDEEDDDVKLIRSLLEHALSIEEHTILRSRLDVLLNEPFDVPHLAVDVLGSTAKQQVEDGTFTAEDMEIVELEDTPVITPSITSPGRLSTTAAAAHKKDATSPSTHTHDEGAALSPSAAHAIGGSKQTAPPNPLHALLGSPAEPLPSAPGHWLRLTEEDFDLIVTARKTVSAGLLGVELNVRGDFDASDLRVHWEGMASGMEASHTTPPTTLTAGGAASLGVLFSAPSPCELHPTLHLAIDGILESIPLDSLPVTSSDFLLPAPLPSGGDWEAQWGRLEHFIEDGFVLDDIERVGEAAGRVPAHLGLEWETLGAGDDACTLHMSGRDVCGDAVLVEAVLTAAGSGVELRLRIKGDSKKVCDDLLAAIE